MKSEEVWMMGGGKDPWQGRGSFPGISLSRFQGAGIQQQRRWGRICFPIAAVTVYIKVCPPTLVLFFYTQLTLIHCMSNIQFQFLVIVLTCHKSIHHAK